MLGALLAVALNVDTLRIADRLWAAPLERATLVAQAEAMVSGKALPALPQQESSFPVGWASEPFSVYRVPTHLPGWLITALAISIGAPFWFDLLSRFMQVRSAAKPREDYPPAGGAA